MGCPHRTERNLGSLLRRKAELHGDRVFAHYCDETKSYAGLYMESCRIARGLHELGVRKGDKVAILMSNALEYLPAWFGIVMLGAVEVPLNFNYKGRSLVHALQQCDAEVLIVETAYADMLASVQSQLTKLGTVI